MYIYQLSFLKASQPIQESQDIEHNISNNTLYISKINKNKTQSLSSFLITLELSKYKKIVFSQCDLDENDFSDLDNIADRYKKILVFQFNKCNFAKEVSKIKFSSRNVIIEIVSYSEMICIFPENKTAQINNKNFHIEFYDDSKLFTKGIDFSNQTHIDTFKKVVESCPNLIKYFIFEDCVFDTKLDSVLKLIKDKQSETISLVFQHPKKFNEQIFVNHSDLIIEVIGEYRPSFIKGTIKVNIPLSININMYEKNCITIQDISLFKDDNIQNWDTWMSFCLDCLLIFDCITFTNCKLNDKFLKFFSDCAAQKDKLNGKIIKLMNNCTIDGDKSLLKKLIELVEKTRYSFIFICGDLTYIDSTQLDDSNLKINQNSFHFVLNFLKKNKNSLNIKAMHIKGVTFNEVNSMLLKDVLSSENMQYLNSLKLEECELETPFLKIIDYIKNNIELKFLYYIKISRTKASTVVLEESRKISNCSFIVSHRDPESNIEPKQKSKMRCEFLQKLITEAAENAEKIQILSQITCYPGLPGQALAEMNKQLFLSQSSKIIRKNLEDIADSWIIGYKQEKQQIINSVLSFMKNRDMKRQKYILLYGPAGAPKFTFACMIAAMIKYADTNDLEGSMYHPKKKETEIKSWLKVIQGSEITSKETLYGNKTGPGIVVDKLKSSDEKVFNVIMLINELDKIKKGENSNVMDVLNLLLDPTQRCMFEDKFLKMFFDLDKCIIICTATDMNNIDENLKNIMNLVYIKPS